MTIELSLIVNDAPIRTDYFVEGLIDHVVSGIVEALEGGGKIKDLNLVVEGHKVTVNLNGAIVPINSFVSKIIKSTIVGMVSTLKGVTDVKNMRIIIHK
jgi:hypothetical protein